MTSYSSSEKSLHHITLIKKELRRSPKLKVLAWRRSRLHGLWVKRVFFSSAVIPSTVSSLMMKCKAYPHPLLERPLLKTCMTSLVWLFSILLSDLRVIFFNRCRQCQTHWRREKGTWSTLYGTSYLGPFLVLLRKAQGICWLRGAMVFHYQFKCTNICEMEISAVYKVFEK